MKSQVSHKSRRLVERMIGLHIKKHITQFYGPDANVARAALDRQTRISKSKLMEHIATLEHPAKRRS